MGRIRKAELVNLVIFAFGRYIDYRLTDVKNELIEEFGELIIFPNLLILVNTLTITIKRWVKVK